MGLALLDLREKRFLYRFFPSFAVLFLIILLAPMQPLLELTAQTQVASLRFIGIPAIHQGDVVYAGSAAYQIVNECTPAMMFALLACLLYASGAREKQWLALLIALPAFAVINSLRLTATIATGALYGQGAMEAMHFAMWLFDAAVVMAAWYWATGGRIGGSERAGARKETRVK